MRSIARTALAVLVPTVLATTGAAAQSSAPQKFAFIRSQEILAQAPGRAEAEAQFQKELEAYKAQVQRMSDSLNTMVQAYEKSAVTLSPTAKETREKEIRAKQEAYQTRTHELDQQMQQKQDQLVRPIMEEVNKVIEQIRTEDGYAFVFDASAANGVIVAADKSLDITDKVLARLKASGVATKPGPTGPVQQPAGATTRKPTPQN